MTGQERCQTNTAPTLAGLLVVVGMNLAWGQDARKLEDGGMHTPTMDPAPTGFRPRPLQEKKR